MFEFKPDYEASQQRLDAFWEHELLDRPVVQFILEKPVEARRPFPPSHHPNFAARWLDAQYQAECAYVSLANQEFLGDSMPVAWPNLGPEIFAVFYGCPIFFDDYGAIWTEPLLHNWEDADRICLDWQSAYLAKLLELTDAYLEIGRGKFITGMSDWHPGGDWVAALRDPANLAMDMLDQRAAVVRLLNRCQDDYFRVYDLFYDKLRAAGQPISTWTPLTVAGKFYLPSNDFSCMISKTMYDEVFLPGIQAECRFLDRSLYHLDGRNALRHLDSLLAIPELDAIQWVPGAGREEYARWIDVCRKIQAGGKGLQVRCTLAEIDKVMETLDPRGVCLWVNDVPDRDAAELVLRKVTQWPTGRVF